MNYFELARNWWDYSFENPEQVKPNHTAIYFFTLEHCNRLGWKDKFGLPTTMVMEAVGIKSYNTYITALNDIIEWGFITLIEKSKNQHSSNIVALSKKCKAHNKALDKALIKHGTKQRESTVQSTQQSTGESNCSIDIPITSLPITNIPFNQFWDLYDKKIERDKCERKWNALKDEDRVLIMEYIPKYKKAQPDKQYRKNPDTFFNNKSWLDEIVTPEPVKTGFQQPEPIKYVTPKSLIPRP